MKHILTGLFFMLAVALIATFLIGGFELLKLYFGWRIAGVVMTFIVGFILITLISWLFDTDKKTKE